MRAHPPHPPFFSSWLRFVCFVLLSTQLQHESIAQQQKPNVIFILTDDMGYTDLGCYGNPYNQTPYIDELASQGMRFSQAYVASPICSPSRAAILTGKHPARLHLTNFWSGIGLIPSRLSFLQNGQQKVCLAQK